jgi:hypothetical protein
MYLVGELGDGSLSLLVSRPLPRQLFVQRFFQLLPLCQLLGQLVGEVDLILLVTAEQYI